MPNDQTPKGLLEKFSVKLVEAKVDCAANTAMARPNTSRLRRLRSSNPNAVATSNRDDGSGTTANASISPTELAEVLMTSTYEIQFKFTGLPFVSMAVLMS